jgi:hypothetical protein
LESEFRREIKKSSDGALGNVWASVVCSCLYQFL